VRLFIYLTPCIPLSFKGEGELVFEEGAKPLFDFLFYFSLKREGEE